MLPIQFTVSHGINFSHIMVGGFYRVWTHENKNSMMNKQKEWTSSLAKLLKQHKWNRSNFIHKKVAEKLKEALDLFGLSPRNMGDTFMSDIVQKSGKVATSAIDHIYVARDLESRTSTLKLSSSSSDDLPIIAKIKRMRKSELKMKTVTRRNTKHMTKSRLFLPWWILLFHLKIILKVFW